MSFEVKSISVFEKQAKRLIKKYPSLQKELLQLVRELKENPVQGKAVGKNCYKIRLAIASKGKGKSGASRIVTHLVITKMTVYLLSVYDKSEKDSITDKELIELLSFIPE